MTKEQYEKLKEYIYLLVLAQINNKTEKEWSFHNGRKSKCEKELDKLMFPEGEKE